MDEADGRDTVYCTSCGSEIDATVNYCTECGEPVRKRGPGKQTEPVDSRNANRGPAEPGATPERQSPESHSEGEKSPSSRAGLQQTRDESPLYTVLIATLLGIGGVVLLIIFSIPVIVISRELEVAELVVLVVGTGIGQYVAFVGLGLVYLRHREFDWTRIRSYLGIRVPTLRELGIVILGYVVIFALIMVVGALVQAFGPQPAENEGAETFTGTTNPAVLVGAVLMMFLVVGPCEELLYRGIVQNRLRERLSSIPAILIASTVFAAVHFVVFAPGASLPQKLTTIGILFCPAIVLGSVYEYTGNLVVPSLLHSIHNSIIVLISFAGTNMQENAEFISGLVAVLGL
jgi:membrane protease YdiL (CAAX protease family)